MPRAQSRLIAPSEVSSVFRASAVLGGSGGIPARREEEPSQGRIIPPRIVSPVGFFSTPLRSEASPSLGESNAGAVRSAREGLRRKGFLSRSFRPCLPKFSDAHARGDGDGVWGHRHIRP